QCVCSSCGASSDPLSFIQMVHYISTTSLWSAPHTTHTHTHTHTHTLISPCAYGPPTNQPTTSTCSYTHTHTLLSLSSFLSTPSLHLHPPRYSSSPAYTLTRPSLIVSFCDLVCVCA